MPQNNNDLPPELAAMVAELEASGATVTVQKIDSSAGTMLETAADAMAKAGYSEDKVCHVNSAMALLLDSQTSQLLDMANHLAAEHESLAALDFMIAFTVLADTLFPMIAKAEKDTGGAFRFTNRQKTQGELASFRKEMLDTLRQARDQMAAGIPTRTH